MILGHMGGSLDAIVSALRNKSLNMIPLDYAAFGKLQNLCHLSLGRFQAKSFAAVLDRLAAPKLAREMAYTHTEKRDSYVSISRISNRHGHKSLDGFIEEKSPKVPNS